MTAIMTILEANVPAEDSGDLPARWREMAGERPAQLVDSWLIQGLDGGDAWAAVAIWPSREALDEYRRSVDAPAAVKLFRSVNAEPLLGAFRIVAEV